MGKAVVARNVEAYWLEKSYILVHRTTAGRTLNSMGLTWIPIGKAKKTYASYCIFSIREFLTTLDKYD